MEMQEIYPKTQSASKPVSHSIVWRENNLPYSSDYDDSFYSADNGRKECQHVFIAGNQLDQRFAKSPHFTIAELGFGTALNFLETWSLWRKLRQPGQQLDYVAFEISPLDFPSLGRAAANWSELAPLAAVLLKFWQDRGVSPGLWQMDKQTTLELIIGDARHRVKTWPDKADAWYLDGFSPSKNPEMWSAELMSEVATHTSTNGTFATYTAAGWVRQNLIAAGFRVSRQPGHGKKRHMSVGVIEA